MPRTACFPAFRAGVVFLLAGCGLFFSDYRQERPAYAAAPVALEPASPAKLPPAPDVSPPVPGVSAPAAPALAAHIDAGWQPLVAKLEEDGIYGQDVAGWFAALENPYSQKPMGLKITGLFRSKYIFSPFAFLRKPQKTAQLLQGIVTKENTRDSAEFILANPELFALIEREYKVDKEIAAALFMVETRLGAYLGTERAFWSLACMALADRPEQVQSYLDKLPLTEERLLWVGQNLQERSERAYKELTALIEYCRKNRHNPLEITGSLFGAIGFCQFMPSNIALYAVDGDKDGRIDLFTAADALPSMANYLVKHGWKAALNRKQRFAVIRRYNHSDVYANTVLALADAVRSYLRDAAKKSGR
ncbi:MAG: lytic murein transglycosylase [Deltaproteobacteria bacterium]|nr:lytic murein transglycosylase [Deltaproteobacteria bacterium]